MTTSEQIRVLCVRSGVSLSELARRINQTPQNFSVKLKRNTVTQDELNQIANPLLFGSTSHIDAIMSLLLLSYMDSNSKRTK